MAKSIRRNILFALLVVLCCFLVGCNVEPPVFVTATPFGTVAPSEIPVETAIPVTPDVKPTINPSPTVSVNSHRDCAESVDPCYVNRNPFLIDGNITHSTWNGRNTDIPEAYRLKLASTTQAPFIYCYVRYEGCQFEFQWLDGAIGYQTEDITLEPDTVYIVKMVYSLDVGCSQVRNCSVDQLSTDMLVFIDGVQHRFQSQPVVALSVENQESLWAIQIDGDRPVDAAIQTFLRVEWATFAEPAKFTIHEIGVIAMPQDFGGFVYSLN